MAGCISALTCPDRTFRKPWPSLLTVGSWVCAWSGEIYPKSNTHWGSSPSARWQLPQPVGQPKAFLHQPIARLYHPVPICEDFVKLTLVKWSTGCRTMSGFSNRPRRSRNRQVYYSQGLDQAHSMPGGAPGEVKAECRQGLDLAHIPLLGSTGGVLWGF